MPWGNSEPQPVRPHQHLLEAPEGPRRPERALQAQRRRGAEADRGVHADGVDDAHAPEQRLGIVVGHLVPGDVGPHLEHAHARVARARAREEDADGDRRARRRRQDHGRGKPQAPTDQGSRDPRGEQRARGRADGGGPAHGRQA